MNFLPHFYIISLIPLSSLLVLASTLRTILDNTNNGGNSCLSTS